MPKVLKYTKVEYLIIRTFVVIINSAMIVF